MPSSYSDCDLSMTQDLQFESLRIGIKHKVFDLRVKFDASASNIKFRAATKSSVRYCPTYLKIYINNAIFLSKQITKSVNKYSRKIYTAKRSIKKGIIVFVFAHSIFIFIGYNDRKKLSKTRLVCIC